MENLKKNSKKLYQDYKAKIIDIVLFGSFAKGKQNPSDIDIAIILKNTSEKEILNLREEFIVFFSKEVHLNFILIETLFNNPLFKTLLKEGISLIDNKKTQDKMGYASGSIFSLRLTKLPKSKKVLFSYALHGHKGNEGQLKRVNGKEVGRAVLYIPSEYIDEFKQFLELWNVDFSIMNVLKE